jgi:hypothetical protein
MQGFFGAGILRDILRIPLSSYPKNGGYGVDSGCMGQSADSLLDSRGGGNDIVEGVQRGEY